MKSKLVYLPHRVLLHHPDNMRPEYPEAQVAEMAASIKARGGVEQPLIVVRGPRGKYYVVDGNVRLEGARRLGPDCPLLKCEVRSQADAEQLLTMAVTNRFRYRVDPISEARHYRRLMRRRKYTVKTIAKAVGVPLRVIADLLLLLKLPVEIQDLIAKGQWPKDARVARALVTLPPQAATKLAQQMTRASIPSILRAVEKLKEALAVARPAKGGGVRQSPAICLARARKAQCHPEDPGSLGKPSSLPPDTRPMPWRLIREAAQQTCRTCEVLAETLASVSEPAWALVAHLASETCGDCALADIGSACSTCPQVDLLRRLVRQTRRERMNAAPA